MAVREGLGTRGASGWGSTGWGCESGFGVGSCPPAQRSEPAVSISAHLHGKAQGKAALCPGQESHGGSALLLPIPGAPQHPHPWRHSVARHGMAGCLPLHLPYGKEPVAVPAWCPSPYPCCLACAASPRHRAWASRGCGTPILGSTKGPWGGPVQGLEHCAEQGDMHLLLQGPPVEQGRAPRTAPCLPPAYPPGSGPRPWLHCLHAAWRRFRPHAWFLWQLQLKLH